ncbi:unnamed protein product, partial [Hapterophycus canaliculatus]
MATSVASQCMLSAAPYPARRERERQRPPTPVGRFSHPRGRVLEEACDIIVSQLREARNKKKDGRPRYPSRFARTAIHCAKQHCLGLFSGRKRSLLICLFAR